MNVVLEVLVLTGKLIYFYLEALFRLFVPNQRKNVRGKVVVITGGTGGIGRCLALKFAGLGAKVAVWDVNKVESCAHEIDSVFQQTSTGVE
jgi:FlaA1/EpsC-like NDP-sugar epimerase